MSDTTTADKAPVDGGDTPDPTASNSSGTDAAGLPEGGESDGENNNSSA